MLKEYIEEKYNISNKMDIIVASYLENVQVWDKDTRRYKNLISYEQFMSEYSEWYKEKKETLLIKEGKERLRRLKKEYYDIFQKKTN